jgi:hypothetical protein
MHGMTIVNHSENPGDYSANDPSPAEDAEIVGWVRWWHWLIVGTVALVAFAYYPLWRFEQKWSHLQIGDSVERMKELLGDIEKPSYSVQGASSGSNSDAYVYTRYWKSYEVLVSTGSQRVTTKTVLK